ncbi:hypothetical protein PGB90_003620 [Kerria lacca]
MSEYTRHPGHDILVRASHGSSAVYLGVFLLHTKFLFQNLSSQHDIKHVAGIPG